MRRLLPLMFPLVLAAAPLSGCGSDAPADAPEAPATEAPAAPPAPAPSEPESAAPFEGPAYEATLTPVGDEMLYEQTEFTVAPGQTVRLVFNNTATNPALSHNVVFVRSEADIEPVGMAAMGAADTDYVPQAEAGRILAHTGMAAPGETVEVTFTAPTTPGDYPYICTYPGHYMMMQGVMRVEAP